MDRYFIDLMLELVGKGHRVDDHLFSKRAWKHMTLLFNAKFKFQYEKDVLKNRHKTLRNLYKAITNLLDQKGFSWDETRQMVTADNKVWDNYIMVHPDARSYRIKTIPYYRDLCDIYKNTTTEGKNDLSSESTRLDSNVPGLDVVGLFETMEPVATTLDEGGRGDSLIESLSHPIGVGEATVEALHEIIIDEDFRVPLAKEIIDYSSQPAADMGSTVGTRSRTYWQPPMDRYFIDLMLEQVNKGNLVDGLFRKQAWIEMIESFNVRFGFSYDLDILKNRYKTLRRQYNVIKNLLELDGFFWDNTRQMVTADDRVWQDYIKAHTDARQYMTRPVPYYKDLCIICKELSADGRDSASGHHVDQQDEVLDVKFLKGSRSPTVSAFSDDLVGDQQQTSHVGSKHQLENLSSSGQSKRAKSREECMASALREMATAVSCLADKRREDENLNCFAIENVIEAIQALPDMDEDLVLDACDFLEDEKKAKTFLALDDKLRRKWLIRKLRPEQSVEVK